MISFAVDRRVIVLALARMADAVGNSFLVVVLPLPEGHEGVAVDHLLVGRVDANPHAGVHIDDEFVALRATVHLHGGPETTGTALFVYGMAWGLNNGLLDSATYYPVVTKAWNALLDDALHPNGFLGYVQSTGKEPSTGQPVTYDKVPDFEDYGLGCFLLAGSEVYKIK